MPAALMTGNHLSISFFLFSSSPPGQPMSALFPYTPLFRSRFVEAEHQTTIRLRDLRPGDLERAAAEAEARSEEHTSELQSHSDRVCRLMLEKKKTFCRSYFRL